MEPTTILALVLGGISLLWHVGKFVSERTPNKLDDAVFQHPEVKALLEKLAEALLKRKAP